MRVWWVGSCVIVSALGAYYARPLVHENTDAITVMITVITVFAGFLVAIISILGDPAMIPSGSWRKAEAERPELEATLIRHSYLFYCYLMAIGFLFTGVLLQKACDVPYLPVFRRWVEGLSLFFAILSFLTTLALPRALSRIQLARSNAEIESRRKAEGISTN